MFLSYDRKFPVQRGKFFVSKLLTRILGTITLQTKDGIWLSVFPSSMMDKSYFNDRDESHNITINAINQLSPGDKFIDVGANIGYFSFLAAKKVGQNGKVYSFEPSKREYERLTQCIPINHVDNIVHYNLALSEQQGAIYFFTDEFHTGLNSIEEDSGGQTNEKVICARLDEVVKDGKIDLIKIDVEGAELKVLRGTERLLKTKHVQKLIIEITPKFLAKYGDSKEAVFDFLLKHDYYPVFSKEDWQYDEIFMLKTG